MVRHCFPQARHFWKAWSITKATRGRYPRSSSRVNRGKKMAMGGSITATTQAVTRYTPSSTTPDSQAGAGAIQPSSASPSRANRAVSRAEGPLAPATVSHTTSPNSSSIRGMPVLLEVSRRSSRRWRRRRSARSPRTTWAAYRSARVTRSPGSRREAAGASSTTSRAMAAFSSSSPFCRPAAVPTTGTPSRRDRAGRSTSTPSRSASSSRLTHTSTFPVSSSTWSTRIRLRSRQVASHTTTTASAWPLSM